jgi:peptidoglycan hydrolase-like protein with peptidoglycan-binding domain
MKLNLIAMAVAAAMLSFGAVAQEKKQESQGAQSSPSATKEQKPGSSASGSASGTTSGSSGSAASGASSPSSSGDKQSQRSAGAGGSKAGGHDSETIKQVQTKLKEQGQDPGPADGVMGPKTQAALKEFQKGKGLKESGQLDQQTMSALGVSGSASAGGSKAGAGAGASSSAGSSDKSSEKKQ